MVCRPVNSEIYDRLSANVKNVYLVLYSYVSGTREINKEGSEAPRHCGTESEALSETVPDLAVTFDIRSSIPGPQLLLGQPLVFMPIEQTSTTVEDLMAPGSRSR